MTKKELQTELGRNLRKARHEQHMTIEEVAEQVGISVTFYSNLECGNKMMSLPTLCKLMNVLGISADCLLPDSDGKGQIRNIEMLLTGQPPENIAFIEKMIRFCVKELPNDRQTGEAAVQAEQQDCGVCSGN